jgi:hypothetical protein
MGQFGQSLNASTNALTAAFSPDGHILASTGGDDRPRLWNVTNPGHPARPATP